jgi:hypothetical protein
MHRAIDHSADEVDRHTNLAVQVGMFDFLDSKLFAVASIAAITAALCVVSGVGGEVGLLTLPPLAALIYWVAFR